MTANIITRHQCTALIAEWKVDTVKLNYLVHSNKSYKTNEEILISACEVYAKILGLGLGPLRWRTGIGGR